MTDFLFRNDVVEKQVDSKPVYKPRKLDRAAIGLDDSAWYSTTKGTAIEVNAAYDPAFQKRSVASTSLEGGVLTVTYLVENKTLAELQPEYIQLGRDYLNEGAAIKNYDSIETACQYAAVANTFQVESQTYVVWRAAVWDYCYAELAKIEGALRTVPTKEEFRLELETNVPFPY